MQCHVITELVEVKLLWSQETVLKHDTTDGMAQVNVRAQLDNNKDKQRNGGEGVPLTEHTSNNIGCI